MLEAVAPITLRMRFPLSFGMRRKQPVQQSQAGDNDSEGGKHRADGTHTLLGIVEGGIFLVEELILEGPVRNDMPQIAFIAASASATLPGLSLTNMNWSCSSS